MAYPSSIASFSMPVKAQTQTVKNSPRTPNGNESLKISNQFSGEEESSCIILNMCRSVACSSEKVTREPQMIKPANAMAKKRQLNAAMPSDR